MWRSRVEEQVLFKEGEAVLESIVKDWNVVSILEEICSWGGSQNPVLLQPMWYITDSQYYSQQHYPGQGTSHKARFKKNKTKTKPKNPTPCTGVFTSPFKCFNVHISAFIMANDTAISALMKLPKEQMMHSLWPTPEEGILINTREKEWESCS